MHSRRKIGSNAETDHNKARSASSSIFRKRWSRVSCTFRKNSRPRFIFVHVAAGSRSALRSVPPNGHSWIHRMDRAFSRRLATGSSPADPITGLKAGRLSGARPGLPRRLKPATGPKKNVAAPTTTVSNASAARGFWFGCGDGSRACLAGSSGQRHFRSAEVRGLGQNVFFRKVVK